MKNATRNHVRPSLVCAICLLAFNLSLSAKASPPSDEDPAPEFSDSEASQWITPAPEDTETEAFEPLTPENGTMMPKRDIDLGPKPIYCRPLHKLPPGARKYYINIFTTAIGHSGTDEACPTVGKSYTRTNPQYVYCRQKGGVVSDKNKNTNYWWLWTKLDTGKYGWISAYYIKGQGNNQAKGIPNCP